MSVLVGRQAPEFKAKAVVNKQFKEDFALADYRGKYVLLFFYPLDFTFVCPTELLLLQEKLADFEKRNTQVIALSVDSEHSHYAWVNTPQNKGGIDIVTYPLVADLNKSISRDYDVLLYEEGVALRGTFLIDQKGIVRHQTVNDLSLGRNIEEFIRLIDALQFSEKHGEVCPANWKKGERSMKPSQEGLQEYFG